MEHRPPITPPIVFAWAHIKMCRKPPVPAVDTFRLLDIFGLDLLTVVIDDDQMHTGGLEKVGKLVGPRVAGGVFDSGDDVVRNPSKRREISLT